MNRIALGLLTPCGDPGTSYRLAGARVAVGQPKGKIGTIEVRLN
jgi:hypothetical protein